MENVHSRFTRVGIRDTSDFKMWRVLIISDAISAEYIHVAHTHMFRGVLHPEQHVSVSLTVDADYASTVNKSRHVFTLSIQIPRIYLFARIFTRLYRMIERQNDAITENGAYF